MKIVIPSDVLPDEPERLDYYYGGTHITFNGHFYDHTRKIYLKKIGNDYILIPHRNDNGPLDVSSALVGHHHYVADTVYNFIASFVTINGTWISSMNKDDMLTAYLSKSFYFFKSLPQSVKASLQEAGQKVFDDYTKFKMIS